ncbi:MAG: hypothetical protein U9R25_14560 [Chloroflexota bacterium]|nr:hypothetical protein [Chloroflexota bacterium]
MAENKEFLTDLDSPIGDVDHGANMHSGFAAVVEKLTQSERADTLQYSDPVSFVT